MAHYHVADGGGGDRVLDERETGERFTFRKDALEKARLYAQEVAADYTDYGYLVTVNEGGDGTQCVYKLELVAELAVVECDDEPECPSEARA